MVSSLLADALRDPTEQLQGLYASSSSVDFPRVVSEHFSRVFKTAEAFKEIPPLDVKHPPESYPDRSLVRFRAMVQDTSPSSEMYLANYKDGSVGGWGIDSQQPEEDHDDVDYGNLRECTVLWAVNVPGESKWSAEELDGSDIPASASSPPQSLRPHKSPYSEGDHHVGVKVKLYDNALTESFKSTDVVTFVGILSTEHSSHDLVSDPIDVPTLHVLFVAPDERTSIARQYPIELEDGSSDLNISQIRQDLVHWLASEALAGDEHAAEWILLSTIARTQSRNPALLQPSLNLTQFPPPPIPTTSSGTSSSSSTSQPLPPPYHPTLTHVLSHLLPLTHTLPLSLPFLNTIPFAPESKDEDLHAGALQLPKGSVLLITEGGVQEGKLHERGIVNVHALQEVMSSQTLSYNFPFSSFSFPTDVSCIVLSEGRKSAFFRTDLVVPLRPQTSAANVNLYKPASSINMPPPQRLTAFRDLIVGAQSGKVQVSEATSEYIQQDFVTERQRNKAVTGDDLIRRMTVAKLYALSQHKTELTIDIWEQAKTLDEQRLARLT
ncbi:hypothetical protein K474DRAFT_1664215 [Panus rudis PR-1116 ss-1]|nr:hypothetical protein K474DRAFT_1664215 [Panus rudis PR-1116 ss-1]